MRGVGLLVAICVGVIYFGPEVYFRLFHRSSWEELRGDYAVVTGASYGIGREFAVQLAREGLNLVVTGRSEDKLRALCEEVPTKCLVVVQDVGKAEEMQVDEEDESDEKPRKKRTKIVQKWWWESEELKSTLAGINVSVLVNNVGGGAPDGLLVPLHESSLSRLQYIMRFNWETTLAWTHLVLPKMVARRRGRILMLSSLARNYGFMEGTYSPAKHAMEGLTRLINNEYSSNYGIRCETLFVGIVSTPALDNIGTDLFGKSVSADYFVQSALRSFGFYEAYAPTLAHGLINFLGDVVPVQIRRVLARYGTEEIASFIKAGADANNKKTEL